MDIPLPDDLPPLPPGGSSPALKFEAVTENVKAPLVVPPPPLPPHLLVKKPSYVDAESPMQTPDIPMPEDPNRYSPSLPIDDDPPLPLSMPTPHASSAHQEVSSPVLHANNYEVPSQPPLPSTSPPPAIPRSIVLGKTQAKKRLLAFSMTKMGGAAGLSFNLAKKPSVLKDASKAFPGPGAGDADTAVKKKPKKVAQDKARNTISEIEELKRMEMGTDQWSLQRFPGYGGMSTLAVNASDSLLDFGEMQRSNKVDSLVDDLLTKKQEKKDEEEFERRKRKEKEERERKKRKERVMPKNWSEFSKHKHKVYYFRKFKKEVEKQEEEKKRGGRRRSRERRSRSREGDRKRDRKSSRPSKYNMLETQLSERRTLLASRARGQSDAEYPQYLVCFTKAKPTLTYCENPKKATRHLASREKMLSTVPPDIEQLIHTFLNEMQPKRLKVQSDGNKDMLLENEQGKNDSMDVIPIKDEDEGEEEVVEYTEEIEVEATDDEAADEMGNEDQRIENPQQKAIKSSPFETYSIDFGDEGSLRNGAENSNEGIENCKIKSEDAMENDFGIEEGMQVGNVKKEVTDDGLVKGTDANYQWETKDENESIKKKKVKLEKRLVNKTKTIIKYKPCFKTHRNWYSIDVLFQPNTECAIHPEDDIEVDLEAVQEMQAQQIVEKVEEMERREEKENEKVVNEEAVSMEEAKESPNVKEIVPKKSKKRIKLQEEYDEYVDLEGENREKKKESKENKGEKTKTLEPIIRTAIRSKWDSDYEEDLKESRKEEIVKNQNDDSNSRERKRRKSVDRWDEDEDRKDDDYYYNNWHENTEQSDDFDHHQKQSEESFDGREVRSSNAEIENESKQSKNSLGKNGNKHYEDDSVNGEEEMDVVPMEIDQDDIEELSAKDSVSVDSSSKVKMSEMGEKLASEYEEFLKMVSFEPGEDKRDGSSNQESFKSNDRERRVLSDKNRLDLTPNSDHVLNKSSSPWEEDDPAKQNSTSEILTGDLTVDKENKSRSFSKGSIDSQDVVVKEKILLDWEGKEKKKKSKPKASKKSKKKVISSKAKKKQKDKKRGRKRKRSSSSSLSSSDSSSEESDTSSSSSSSTSSSDSDSSDSDDSSSSSESSSSSSSSDDSSLDRKKSKKKKRDKKKKQKDKKKRKKKKKTKSKLTSSEDEDEHDESDGKKKKKEKKNTKTKKKSMHKKEPKYSPKSKKTKKSKHNSKKSKDVAEEEAVESLMKDYKESMDEKKKPSERSKNKMIEDSSLIFEEKLTPVFNMDLMVNDLSTSASSKKKKSKKKSKQKEIDDLVEKELEVPDSLDSIHKKKKKKSKNKSKDFLLDLMHDEVGADPRSKQAKEKATFEQLGFGEFEDQQVLKNTEILSEADVLEHKFSKREAKLLKKKTFLGNLTNLKSAPQTSKVVEFLSTASPKSQTSNPSWFESDTLDREYCKMVNAEPEKNATIPVNDWEELTEPDRFTYHLNDEVKRGSNKSASKRKMTEDSDELSASLSNDRRKSTKRTESSLDTRKLLPPNIDDKTNQDSQLSYKNNSRFNLKSIDSEDSKSIPGNEETEDIESPNIFECEVDDNFILEKNLDEFKESPEKSNQGSERKFKIISKESRDKKMEGFDIKFDQPKNLEGLQYCAGESSTGCQAEEKDSSDRYSPSNAIDAFSPESNRSADNDETRNSMDSPPPRSPFEEVSAASIPNSVSQQCSDNLSGMLDIPLPPSNETADALSYSNTISKAAPVPVPPPELPSVFHPANVPPSFKNVFSLLPTPQVAPKAPTENIIVPPESPLKMKPLRKPTTMKLEKLPLKLKSTNVFNMFDDDDEEASGNKLSRKIPLLEHTSDSSLKNSDSVNKPVNIQEDTLVKPLDKPEEDQQHSSPSKDRNLSPWEPGSDEMRESFATKFEENIEKENISVAPVGISVAPVGISVAPVGTVPQSVIPEMSQAYVGMKGENEHLIPVDEIAASVLNVSNVVGNFDFDQPVGDYSRLDSAVLAREELLRQSSNKIELMIEKPVDKGRVRENDDKRGRSRSHSPRGDKDRKRRRDRSSDRHGSRRRESSRDRRRRKEKEERSRRDRVRSRDRSSRHRSDRRRSSRERSHRDSSRERRRDHDDGRGRKRDDDHHSRRKTSEVEERSKEHVPPAFDESLVIKQEKESADEFERDQHQVVDMNLQSFDNSLDMKETADMSSNAAAPEYYAQNYCGQELTAVDRMDDVTQSGSPPSPLGFKRSVADSTTASENDLVKPKRLIRYSPELSPKRLSLDERLARELGVKENSAAPPPPPPPPPHPHPSQTHLPPPHHQQLLHPPPHQLQNLNYQQLQQHLSVPPPSTPAAVGLLGSSSQHIPLLSTPPAVNWDNPEAFIGSMAVTTITPSPTKVTASPFLQVGNMLQVVPSDPVEKAPSVSPGTPGKVPKVVDGPTMIQVGNILQLIPSPALSNTPTPSKTVSLEAQSPAVPLPVPAAVEMPVAGAASCQTSDLTPVAMETVPTLPSNATITAASIVAALFKRDTHPLALPMPPAMSEAEKIEQKRLEKKQKRIEKEARKQAKLKKATKKMIRKALLFKESMALNSDVDNEEMKLIEEAMEATAEEEPVPAQPVEVEDPELTEQRLAALRKPLPPPPEKGILISPGFREKPILIGQKSEAKSVSFADGIKPGEGSSPLNAEDHPHSPPPSTKLPKSKKRFSKKKKKRKIKVKIIRVEEGDDDDDEDDDISPPPPPPGSPPPMFHYPPPPPGFAYPPQAFTVPGATSTGPPGGEGQQQAYAPLYQQHHHHSTITTHTTTTVQFGAPPPPPPPPAKQRK